MTFLGRLLLFLWVKIAPEIDEVNNRRLVGKNSNEEFNNQSYDYKLDQTQDMKTPK